MLNLVPNEIIIHIIQFIRDPNDIRSMEIVNKKLYNIVKNNFIDKEKWINLNIYSDRKHILNLLINGLRYIKTTNKIEKIVNYTYHSKSSQQIITYNRIISGHWLHFNKQSIPILIDAPYYFKVKGLKI